MTVMTQQPSPLAQKAHKCYQQGDFAGSIALFQEALAQDPQSSILHQALGNVYKASNKLPEALVHYQESLKYNPDDWSCYYHIGLLYNKIEAPEKAIEMFGRALDRAPARPEVHIQLAQTYALTDNLEKAIAHYQRVLEQKLDNPKALFNIGLLLIKRNRYTEAREYLEKALTFYEADPELFFNLGLVTHQLQYRKTAMDYYQRALALLPTHAQANHNVACLHLANANEDLALAHFRASVAVEPNNVTANYLIKALSQEDMPDQAPLDYLKKLFNEYAPRYDEHLFKELKAQGPNEIRRLMGPLRAKHPEPWRALDLGCGTGVGAPYFHDIVERLEGVDIAEQMIYLAKETGYYQHLYNEDFFFTLAKNHNYNFIFSIDTVIYMGDLKPILKAVRGALVTGGYFAFSIEQATPDVTTYRLQTIGRYMHNKDALLALAEELGFTVCVCEVIPLREHHKEWCMGWGIVLQKGPRE